MKEWTRLGALFNTAPSRKAVDLEDLLIRTATAARADERLFVMMASWLVDHHALVDARRLGRRLEVTTPEASAVLGATMALALTAITGPSPLRAAITHCRPHEPMEPLFPIVFRTRGLLALVQAEALPLFAQWGFWHNDATLKSNAIRPIEWIVGHCPELRMRALLGTGLEAELIALTHEHPRAIADLTRETGATYAAVHTATSRLAARGLLLREPTTRAWKPSPLTDHAIFTPIAETRRWHPAENT